MEIVLKTYPFSELVKHLKTGSELEHIIAILPKCDVDGPWIAGGSLLHTYCGNKIPSDIDVFFSSETQFNAYIEQLQGAKSNKYDVVRIEKTTWFTSVFIKYMECEYKIQCINMKYFSDIRNLFLGFDINICMIAYDGDNIIVNEGFFESVKARTFVFNLNSIKIPKYHIKRLVKYTKYGFNIQDENLYKFTKALMKCNTSEEAFNELLIDKSSATPEYSVL